MAPKIIVVGLGPSGPDLITAGSLAHIANAKALFVRTMRHPAAVVLEAYNPVSFDPIYEAANTVAEVYETIVATLVRESAQYGVIAYVVPGSPVVAEHTVELLVADDRVEVELVPALSFVDLTWVRLGIDPVAHGVQLVDGQRFEENILGLTGPLLVSQTDTKAVLGDIKLAVEDFPDEPITVLYHLGLDDEAIFEVAWEDLDRSFEPDHLTSLWIPHLPTTPLVEVREFADVVALLRRECVWDAEQTHTSLTPYLLEEAYEVLEVLDAAPVDEDDEASFEHFYERLGEELGDLLYQVMFHAQIAAEEGYFNFGDVAAGIRHKLEARNPQIFNPAADDFAAHANESDTVEAQEERWELVKQREKARNSAFDGLVSTLPALVLATQVEAKAARAGLVLDETLGTELGERLLALVLEARQARIDPESVLRSVVREREVRYRQLEADRERRSPS